MSNRGKSFEEKFKEDWENAFPNTFTFRLKDQWNGFKETSKNPCDFLCYPGNGLYMIECKSHKGNSIPFSAIPQYERLLEYKGLNKVYPGVVIWFIEKDTVIWVSIDGMERMVKDGKKSVSLSMLKNNLYNIVVIPSIKKRVYMNSNYSILVDLYGGSNE